MFDWAADKLGIPDLLRRISELERRADGTDGRMDKLEHQVSGALGHFGDYKKRTAEELSLMKAQLADMLATAESLVAAAEHTAAEDQAKALRRRLKNHMTRAQNAQARLAA